MAFSYSTLAASAFFWYPCFRSSPTSAHLHTKQICSQPRILSLTKIYWARHNSPNTFLSSSNLCQVPWLIKRQIKSQFLCAAIVRFSRNPQFYWQLCCAVLLHFTTKMSAVTNWKKRNFELLHQWAYLRPSSLAISLTFQSGCSAFTLGLSSA